MDVVTPPPVPLPKLSEFGDRLRKTLNAGACCFGLSVGCELGLFEVLNRFQKPASSAAIADEAKLNERYVREWLKLMVVSDILVASTDEESGEDLYFVPMERRQDLLGPLPLSTSLVFSSFNAAYSHVIDCFHKGGGIPYSTYSDFHTRMNAVSTERYKRTLHSQFIPSVPNLERRLTDGIDVCDLGCGEGTVLMLMAQTFPRSRFYGYDFNSECIGTARSRVEKKGLSNVTFEVRDASALGDDCPHFDYVTTFDAIHDQARPDLCLSEISRVLRSDGVYSMVDIAASVNPQNNIKHPMGSFLAASSLCHCMPVSLYFPGGMGLGSLWGWETATKMLRSAGFSHIEIKQAGIDLVNYHYISSKTSQYPWS